MSDTFASILDQAPGIIERPPVMPVGVYQWMIAGPHVEGKSREKQTPFVEFQLTCQGAVEVDPTALEEFTSKVGDVRGQRQRITFYITENANTVFAFDNFLYNILGIGSPEEITRKQALAEAVNRSFLAAIRHESSSDGQRVEPRINNFSLAAV